MTINKSNVSFFLSILSLVVVVSIGTFFFLNRERTAYVDASKLFNEFKMKKALENEFKKVENMRKMQLDSMVMILKVMDRGVSTKEEGAFLEYKKEEFAQKQNEFAKANEALSQKYNEQIWNQLNQYIKDYSDKAGYDYVYGATGDGTLMYAAERRNITEEVIKYTNEKYEGLK
jgi:outer membrane protein